MGFIQQAKGIKKVSMTQLFGCHLGASLLPCLGEMLEVWKLPWASRVKPGQEHNTRDTESKDKEVCGIHSPLGLPSPRLSSALPDTLGTRQLDLPTKTPKSPCSSTPRFAQGSGIQSSLLSQALNGEIEISAARWVSAHWLPVPAPLPYPFPLPF